MFEFECFYKGEEKKVCIDLSTYSSVSYEYDSEWSKGKYVLKLYFLKTYCDSDGCVTCERDYDYFNFGDKDSCLIIYESIKNELIKRKGSVN